MRVLVCGGRDCEDEAFVFAGLDALHAERRITWLIEGGQVTRRGGCIVGGVDLFAGRWAYRNRVGGKRYNAEWGKYGRAAGPIRNQRMIDEGKPDLVLAFPGGRGTADMVARARAAGIPVREIGGRS